MLNIALCDDQAQQREHIFQMLLNLSVKSALEFNIETFSSGEQLIAYYEEDHQPFHIIILDIEMSGISGIQTAKKLREMKRFDEKIVFLTSYPEYMLDSFDVVTFQYMLKPVTVELFESKILQVCDYIHQHSKNLLIIKSGFDDVVLQHNDLILIEAAKSLTIKSQLKFTTTHGIYYSKGLISSYVDQLKPFNFLHIHRSVVIHLRHVQKFTVNQVVMSNGLELPIGRSKIKEVKDSYTKYMITRMD